MPDPALPCITQEVYWFTVMKALKNKALFSVGFPLGFVPQDILTQTYKLIEKEFL